jgi:hypothetical protein
MSSSVLAPAYALTLGEQEFTAHALAIDLELGAAPLLDVLTVRLPIAAAPSAAAGDPAVLHLAAGDAEADVFTGTIAALRRSERELTITALDAGAALAAYRPAATFEQVTGGSVIRSLCGDAGVSTGALEDGPVLAFYVADPGRNAYAHVARVAGWCGALARVNGDGELDADVVDAGRAEVALRYGRDVLGIDERHAAPSTDAWVVTGEAGAGTASAPEALRPTSDFFAANRPDGPSFGNRWRFEPALRTSAAASGAGAALARAQGARERRGILVATLQPRLRPGIVVEVQDLPDGIDGGPMWVDHVTHRLAPTGAHTRARIWQGGETAGLLGSLGGLL